MTCRAKTKTGRICGFQTLVHSDFCFSHDPRPEIAERRRTARRRGGESHRRYIPQLPALAKAVAKGDVRELLAKVLENEDVLNFEIKALKNVVESNASDQVRMRAILAIGRLREFIAKPAWA